MDSDTKTSLVAAANLLIRSPQAHYLHGLVTSTAALLARYPELRLTGDAAPLTALGRMKVNHPDVYEDVIHLVERKREEGGLEPLVPESEGGAFDKTAYMQEFMEKKRLRQRRAVAIENMMRAERDKLVGRSRLDFMQRQSEIWKKERDALLERAKAAAHPRRLTKDEQKAVISQFWANLDAKLDALEAVARAKGVSRSAASLPDIEALLSR